MKVLMVCLGNICRSPMAEGIVRELGGDKVEVDSAGTAGYHIGNHPDKRMTATAFEHNIDISNLRARQFEVEDFDNFDIIFAMDSSNFNKIVALARNEDDKQKVKMMLPEGNVPDPYYGGDEGFEHVYELLLEACQNFVDSIE